MQFASRGGTLEALARMGAVCESIFWGTSTRVGISVDFSKLFNTIDARVCMRAAIIMGLHEQDAFLLADPLCRARGMWRMPLGNVSPIFAKDRGLPQGMSTSVLFAEIFVSLFLWRLTMTLGVLVAAYVDDINIIAESPQRLKLAILQLIWFSETFCLDLSRPKSFLWGAPSQDLLLLSSEFGFPVRDVVHSLGTDWTLRKGVLPSSDYLIRTIKDLTPFLND